MPIPPKHPKHPPQNSKNAPFFTTINHSSFTHRPPVTHIKHGPVPDLPSNVPRFGSAELNLTLRIVRCRHVFVFQVSFDGPVE